MVWGRLCREEMSMQTRYHLNALFVLVLLGAATAADGQVQPQVAQRYFEEAKRLCERDAGRLWGVSLCGPMVIVDQATGTRATSQPEPGGPPPRFAGFADGPVSWGGLRWFSFPLYMLPEKDADVLHLSVILLNQVVQVLVGPDEGLSGQYAFGLQFGDGLMRRPTAVERDLL